MTIRTRIAPSPTGEDLHIGNAYTALINYVFAKKNNGKFIVRIEDTDRARLVAGAQERILSSLHWLGLDPDGKPRRQSERLAIYKEKAKELVAKGYAYWCSCTPERISEMRKIQEASHKAPMYDGHCRQLNLSKGFVVRLKVPKEGITTFNDIIRGRISFENKLIDDQVLLKSDGYPTYHLGVVVDDHLMEISHVIRGEEWISSTPKHILLYKFLAWELPQYAHVPLLRNPDKSKLSKRRNPVWASWYKQQGFLPEAILNYLATLAWSYPDGRDLFSIEEMINEFRLEDIKTSAPIFDVEKLKWLNGKYLRSSNINEFYKGKYPENKIKEIWPLVKDRMKILTEFESLAGFLFERPKELERPVEENRKKLLKTILSSTDWNHDAIEKSIREVAEKKGIAAKDLFMDLRVSVTGKTVGPPLLESLEILGKEKALARLDQKI